MVLSRPSPRPQNLAARALGLLAVLAFAVAALAANFPALTGRVVDQANVIPPETRTALNQKLADLEAKSGIQLVVATVSSLDGEEIEPYANALFRHWALGQKDKNNGVLLLVAPHERRVRIEVGYGLEGTLTDAVSKIIIVNAMAPRFRTGDFGGGIVRGVDDIVTVLTTDAADWQKRPSLRLDSRERHSPQDWVHTIIPVVAVLMTLLLRFYLWRLRAQTWQGRGPGSAFRTYGHSSGGFGGGGGFSGGGGSSGGGGASGRW